MIDSLNILLAVDTKFPVLKYGGTERVVYSLGKALAEMGHKVTLLCAKGSVCPFADVVEIDPSLPLEQQVPEHIDIAHFNNYIPAPEWNRPYIVTYHGNGVERDRIVPNSVFVSRDHARRHGCDSWVYNGLDWDEYGVADLNKERKGFHFLGNAAWRVKNVKGAINVVSRMPGEPLEVLGGKRFNFKMGMRFTFNPRIHFHGMVDNEAKRKYITESKGLVFPVTWHEPFGLCITESLYYGAPIFGTPYGSLPELVIPEVGRLTNDSSEMIDFLNCAGDFDPGKCHEYAADNFNSKVMAAEYLKCYEKVLNGEPLISKPALPDTSDYRHKEWR
ncbi:MAG: glycosyltransferase [Muribaculaceae bacterium]|nr:glycosyltransferase [Muribaculaceae bacterium]MDE6753807.1 glycosyltransferase [Muribaculaceae bacterium]